VQVPAPFFAAHVVPSQKELASQSASVAHVFLHSLASQAYGAHAVDAPAAGHAPLPSHVPAGVATPDVQVAARHVVVAGGYVQSGEVPLQTPAQTERSVRQNVRLPGTWAMTGPHAPAALHASHAPVHPALQQTPSAQWPLAQSAEVTHAWPSARERSTSSTNRAYTRCAGSRS
jgi:hypothetical protein